MEKRNTYVHVMKIHYAASRHRQGFETAERMAEQNVNRSAGLKPNK